MSDFVLKPYLRQKAGQVNQALEKLLPGGDASDRIVAAMRHSLMAGGKRLRPVMCMAAAEAVSGNGADALQAACAIEMIHTYSLIHDDLPAMDDDALRRGKPTCHTAFDEATAILAGDALLTLAFETLASVRLHSDADLPRVLQVIRTIAAAAGYRGMIEGQMRDMAAEGASLELDALETVHHYKTGAMFQAAVCSGAILGGGREEEIEKMRAYARHVGLAFQIADDILNVEGDPGRMGKSVGTDSARKKTTYPALLGLAQSKALARNSVNNALQALSKFDKKADPLRAIASYSIERRR